MTRPAFEFNFYEHLKEQCLWSAGTFGPGKRTKGVIAHIRKELIEIENKPQDIEEWIDVIILALDGAWREGATPEDIINTLKKKTIKNQNREWPDWRDFPADAPTEHIKQKE